MVKIVHQPYGSDMALGIYGNSREEVQIEANNLYNYEITNSKPHYFSDNFAYVLTSKDRLIKGLEARCMVGMQFKETPHRIVENGARVSKLKDMAKAQAAEMFEEIMMNREDFIKS